MNLLITSEPWLSLWLWLGSVGAAGIFFVFGLLVGRRACAALRAECDRIKADSEEQRRADFAARVTMREHTEAVGSALALHRERVHALESALEHAQTVRHDLVVTRELLHKQRDKAQRFEDANASLRMENDALAARAVHNDSLERELADLRARSLASEMLSPPKPVFTGPHTLDVLAAELLRVHPVRAAVVGDDLGLVVACQGNYGDELAALGALFNRACSEARRILPLRRIERIAIEDAGHTHLNVWPLRGGGIADDDDQLTLVTLAHGFEPDPVRVARTLARVASGGIEPLLQPDLAT